MATITAAAGGGNWSATGTWTGGVVPTAADDVKLAATSGAVVIDVNANCRSIDCTGYTATLTHNTAITLYIGDATAGASNVALLFVAGMTYTLGSTSTSAITFYSTNTTQQTIAWAAKATGNVFFGSGTSQGSYILTSAAGTTSANTITLTSGTLNTGGYNWSMGSFVSSNTNTRSLALGASQMTIGGTWNIGTSTNMTLSSGTSMITQSAGNASFQGGGFTYYNASIGGTNGTCAYSGANTFNNLTFTGTSSGRVTLANDITVTGSFSVASSSNTSVSLIRSSANGTTRTITAAAIGSLTDMNFSDVAAAGAAIPWTGTRLGDALGNSNITFTAAVTRYWVGSGGNWANTTKWAATSGGTSGASIPLPQDTVVFDANSNTTTGQNININAECLPTLDFTNIANSPTVTFSITNGQIYIIGNLIGSTTITLAGTTGINLYARGNQTIDMKGNTSPFAGSVTIDCYTGTYSLANNFITVGTFNLNSGTFSAVNFNVTANLLASTVSTTRTVNMGSGTWTATGTGTILDWRSSATMTLNPGTSTLTFSDMTAAAKTISFDSSAAGWDLWNMTEPAGGASSVITWSGTVRINNNLNLGGPNTVSLTAGTTKTISGITTIGAASQVVALQSTSSGSKAYMIMNGNSGKQVIDSGTTRTAEVQQTFLVTAPITGNARASNGSNLMPNPSFETGVNGWAIGNIPSGTTLTQSTNAAYAAANSARVLNTGTSADDVYIYYTLSGLTTNSVYTISAWRYLETRTSAPNTNRALLAYANGITGVVSTNETSTALGTWVRYTLTANTLAGTNLTIRLYNPGGISYWDAVQVEPGYNATPYSDGVLVGQTNIQKGFGKSLPTIALAIPQPSLILRNGAYVNFGTGVNLASQSFTISYRTKRRGYFGTQAILLGLGSASNNNELQLGFDGGNFIKFDTYGPGASLAGSAITDSATHHYVFVYDKSTGTRTIYLDGVQNASGTGFNDFTGTGSLTLGGRGANPAFNPYDGSISNLRIWAGVALTSAQAAAFYNDGTTPAGSVASYTFRDASGTTVADQTGSNTGTINGTGYQWSNAMFLKGLYKTIAYAGTAAIAIFKAITATLTANRTATVSLNGRKFIGRILNYSATATTNLTKTINKMLAYAASATVSMTRRLARFLTFSYSANAIEGMTTQSKRFMALSAVGSATATIIGGGMRYVKMTVSAVASISIFRRIVVAYRRTVLSQDTENITVLKQGE